MAVSVMRVMGARSAGARKWWALAGLTLGVLAVGLDATVLSVALPTLAGALHASATDLQWFVSAYTLALAVGLLPGGMLGDRFGRKKVMMITLAAFGLSSLACAFSTSPGEFIAARTALGRSAGFMIPLVLSIVTVMFADAERTRAVGIWAAANFLALPIGPILGGWLLSNYWWGWVFLLNLPVVVIGLAAMALLVPESRAIERPGLDPAGIGASCGGLALLVYGFIAAGQYGWSSVIAIAAMAGGVAILTAFVLWELWQNQHGGQPLVDLGLFRSARFTWGTVLQAFGIFAMFGLLFGAPQFFQAILGVSAMGSGVRLLPLMAGLALGAGLADRVAARLTTKLTATLGFTLLTCGLVFGATMTVASGNALIATWTRSPASAPGWRWRDCPRPRRTRSAAACSRALRWPARPARRRCWTRCGPRSCTGPTRCCGSVRALAWPGSCSRWRSCPGTPCRTPRPSLLSPRAPKGQNRPMSVLPDATAQVARPGPAGQPGAGRPGLRERKKARTRAAIREHALRLFREQGYDATTVEQIAEAAEVSPSTFFRYFPTKEDVVLQDDMDLFFMEIFRGQPASLSPLAAMRAALRAAFAGLGADDLAQLREAMELAVAVPAVRARMLEEFARTSQVIAQAVADRSGRAASDFAVQVLAGAVVGIAMAAWFDEPGNLEAFGDKFERGLALLEAGLPL